jgi:2-oxoglutarate ferredoxin oxidoreductase subunit alpha
LWQDISPDFTPVAEYKPYPVNAENFGPRLAPGTPIANGIYPLATGLEHDEMGHPSGSPKVHMKMTARRRQKLQKLAATLPTPAIYGPPEGNILLVGWGSTHGPIHEAVDRARAAGDSVSAVHLRHISPLPPGLENIFAGFNHVFVVEMNDEGLYGYGQLCALLRARFVDAKIRGLNKTDGLTFRVREILERAKADLAQGLSKI